MTSSAELLPCPFCGESNLRVQTEHRDIPSGAMGIGTSAGSIDSEVIWCHSCGTFPHGSKWWNRRAVESPDVPQIVLRPRPSKEGK